MDKGKYYLSYDVYHYIIDIILRELCIKSLQRPQPQLSILKMNHFAVLFSQLLFDNKTNNMLSPSILKLVDSLLPNEVSESTGYFAKTFNEFLY